MGRLKTKEKNFERWCLTEGARGFLIRRFINWMVRGTAFLGQFLLDQWFRGLLTLDNTRPGQVGHRRFHSRSLVAMLRILLSQLISVFLQRTTWIHLKNRQAMV